MKQTKAILLALTVILFFGCSKYDDNPGFNLSSKNKRLIGEWELEYSQSSDNNGTTITVENNEMIQDNNGFVVKTPYSATLNLMEDGFFENTIIQGTLPDTIYYLQSWSWLDGSSKKEMIHFGGNSGLALNQDYQISKLTKTELWLAVKYEFKNGNYNNFNEAEFRFKKK